MKGADIIAERYASAIYDYAEARDIVLDVYNAMSYVSDIYQDDEDFKHFIETPLIEIEIKENIISDMFNNDEDIKNILLYILRKNRLPCIKAIAKDYLEIYQKKNNILEVRATFTRELSPQEKERLISILKQKTKKEIDLQILVDKKIIGGGILKIGDHTIDGSLKNEIEKLKYGKK